MKKQTIARLNNIADRLSLSFSDVEFLARVERTLSRWAARECGDSNNYNSNWVEVDDNGNAWQVIQPYSEGEKQIRYRIPNRERGAIKRLEQFCQAHGLHYYHQTDPRGTALYVSREPIPSNNYTAAVPVSF